MRVPTSPSRRTTIVGALLVLSFALFAPSAVGQYADTQKPLTNDDIVAMVKAGLSEAAIVASIGNSGRAFQTAPAALIALKQAGVSDRIIEAMVAGPVRSTPLSAGSETDTATLPSAFGYYILAERILELRTTPVVTTFGLTLADRGMAVDGLSGESALKIKTRTPIVVVYQQSVNISGLRLSALAFVESMKAYQFNILNTSPQFFSGLYKKSPNESIPIGLWRPSRDVELRVEPVAGRTGMYRLVPSIPLEPGRYALYFGDSLHGGDIVFTASQGRQAGALDFEIIGTEGVNVPNQQGTASSETAASGRPADPEDVGPKSLTTFRLANAAWMSGPVQMFLDDMPINTRTYAGQLEVGTKHVVRAVVAGKNLRLEFTAELPMKRCRVTPWGIEFYGRAE